MDCKLWKSGSLLDVLLGVVPSAVFVCSVLNQCSHYYKDRHSKKNLASLPQELIILFKYISFFHVAQIGYSCDTPARFLGEIHFLCRRYPIYNKIPTQQNAHKKCHNNYNPKCMGMAIWLQVCTQDVYNTKAD